LTSSVFIANYAQKQHPKILKKLKSGVGLLFLNNQKPLKKKTLAVKRRRVVRLNPLALTVFELVQIF